MKLSKVIVNPKGTRRVKAGHPWVFRSDVLSADGGPGEIVQVFSNSQQFLGQAFFNPKSQITLRLLTRTREVVDTGFWKRRILEAMERRHHFLKEDGAVRLVFGESDLLPSLIVDRYDRVLVFQMLSLGMDRVREEILTILKEICRPQAVLERNDPPVRELEGLVRQKGTVWGEWASPLEIREGDSVFLVDPLEGQKTGLFLDQADNHLAATRYSRGRVLDLFSYQGGFALAVARSADEVIAVDSSGPALDVLKKNCERNRITNVTPIEANGFDYLREAQDRRDFFDTILLDPPPFVRDRKSLGGGMRGYKEINLRALKILKPGGVLITCSCSQNFTPAIFEETLLEAARDTKREIQVLERRGASPDHPVLLTFPESSYLQCWVVRVM